jgi:hypothetical protein
MNGRICAMTVQELIDALSRLSPDERELEAVYVDEWGDTSPESVSVEQRDERRGSPFTSWTDRPVVKTWRVVRL